MKACSIPLGGRVLVGLTSDMLDRCINGVTVSLRERMPQLGRNPLDTGYDVAPVYDGCAAGGALPIIPLREPPGVKRGDHTAPTCEHGEWTFAGADCKRAATKWRCPTGECQPASTWIN